MRLLARIFVLSALTMLITGCATGYRAVPPSTPTLTLAKAEERSSRFGLKILLPAGDYVPDFADENGVYYLASTSVIFSNIGIHNPLRGGVFIPAVGLKEQRHYAWCQISSANGLIGLMSSGSSSIYTYPLDAHVALTKKEPNQRREPTR